MKWFSRIAVLTVLPLALWGMQCGQGLNPVAMDELRAVGLDQYIGEFSPAVTEDAGDGWEKHTFDTDGGDGPICIAGTPFASFTRAANPTKVIIFLDGGGACWQDFYFCSVLAGDETPGDAGGIFTDSFDTGSAIVDNPFADYSILFASYCDGSVWAGDNDVVDGNFPFGPVRFHRGLRNVTAAIDLAKQEFPQARQILLTGSSAGGVGAVAHAPALVRFIFGNHVKLNVLNDAGPVAINLAAPGIAERAADWQFGQFFPASCTDCDDLGASTPIIDWRLANDATVKEAFYSTDGDSTNRFFLFVPTQEEYRAILLAGHDPLNAAYPTRYKRFIESGDNRHTILGSDAYYTAEIDGIRFIDWAADFVRGQRGGLQWVDLVEDFVPLP